MAKVPFGLRISEDVKNEFTRICKREGVRISEGVEALIKLYLSGAIQIKNEIYAITTKGESNEGNH